MTAWTASLSSLLLTRLAPWGKRAGRRYRAHRRNGHGLCSTHQGEARAPTQAAIAPVAMAVDQRRPRVCVSCSWLCGLRSTVRSIGTTTTVPIILSSCAAELRHGHVSRVFRGVLLGGHGSCSFVSHGTDTSLASSFLHHMF